MKKVFLRYVIPTMISFMVTGIYVSIDGFFVGRYVGDIGLASINIAWPLCALILAIGTGIGMGGAVNISNHMGAGEKEKADRALGNTLILLLLASIILSIFILFCGKPLLQIMGAECKVLELSYGYIKVLGFGSILQIFGTGVTLLLRNQNKTWLTMVLMIINFTIDTILSGVFVMVLGFGVTGAALATLFGQFITVIPSLIILLKKKSRITSSFYRLSKATVQHILKVGAPVMGISFISSFTIMIINRQAIAYGGTTAVAAFAVISYMLSVGQLLLQGVGEGSQPLVSFFYGANNQPVVKQLRRWNYYTAIAISFIAMFGIIALRDIIPNIFGVSEKTTSILHIALPLSALSLPLYAFSRVTTEYFNAIKKSLYATIMVYGEGLIFLPICVITLPMLINLNGVWGAIVLVQFLISLVGLYLRMKSRNTDS